jgi:ribosome-associated protein
MNNNSTGLIVREDAPSFRTAEFAVHALLEHKAENIVVLDLSADSDVADLFVIATAQSEPQTAALSKSVIEGLRLSGEKPLSTEGVEKGQWALLDFVDVIVHIMLPHTREYYQLERLWNDAPSFYVPEDYFSRSDVAERHPDLPLVLRALAGNGDNDSDQA